MLKRFIQLRAIPLGTGDAIGKNRIAPSFFQCFDLMFGILIKGRDPGITDALG